MWYSPCVSLLGRATIKEIAPFAGYTTYYARGTKILMVCNMYVLKKTVFTCGVSILRLGGSKECYLLSMKESFVTAIMKPPEVIIN